MKNLTAETRRRGENQKPTTEARRHGEDHKEVLEIDFSDHPITCDHPITGSATRSNETLKDLLPRLRSAARTLLAALREIFDESAYDRFLMRTKASRSIASYRDFTCERDSAMVKKPRCC